MVPLLKSTLRRAALPMKFEAIALLESNRRSKVIAVEGCCSGVPYSVAQNAATQRLVASSVGACANGRARDQVGLPGSPTIV